MAPAATVAHDHAGAARHVAAPGPATAGGVAYVERPSGDGASSEKRPPSGERAGVVRWIADGNQLPDEYVVGTGEGGREHGLKCLRGGFVELARRLLEASASAHIKIYLVTVREVDRKRSIVIRCLVAMCVSRPTRLIVPAD